MGAKLVESVQVRESEMVTRREEEVRQRQHAAQQAKHGFDVTLRTSEAAQLGYSDEVTLSMSEYPGQEPIEPVFIQRGGGHYSQHASHSSQQVGHMEQHISSHTDHNVSKFDV